VRVDWRFWGPLLGTALALRLLCSLLLIAGMPLVSDGAAYAEQAVDGLGGDEEYYWPPGTSYVLWVAFQVLGEGRWAARIAMIAVSMAALVVTVLLARRVLRTEAAARRTGWVMALMPSAVFMPAQPFSFDTTLLGITLCVLLVLVAWDRRQARWLPLAGLALGLAATARPGSVSILAALVPVALVVAWRAWQAGERAAVQRMVAGALAFGVLLVAPVVPAVLHNEDVGAGATISTNNEGNLFFGNNPYTPDYKTWDQGQHAFDEFEPAERDYLTENFTAGGTPEQRGHMRDLALEYMADHPGRTLWRTANRVRAFWGFDYTYANNLRAEWDAPAPAVGVAALLELGGWFVFGALAIAGLVLARDRFRDGRLLVLLLVVGAYELPHIIAFSGGRWHLPVLGLLAPLVAAGWEALPLRSPRLTVQAVLRSRPLLVGLAVFGLIQVEYAYFVFTAAS
jgi:4-amino-4-deoxy-L-arabinose transferase-like glycosyltransferase